MKQADFIKSTNIPAKLVRAVVRQMGGWPEFEERAEDIARNSADAGWSGFTYYSDTVPFTVRNKAAIMDCVKQLAGDLGEPSSFTLIASFRCLDMTPEDVAEAIYNPRSENRTEVFNALAWFALEEVARAYADAKEQ